MKNDKIVLYMHAGSGNHGCEALANTICRMLDTSSVVVSNDPTEDMHYSLSSICELYPEKKIEKNLLAHIVYYAWRKIMHDPESFMRYRFASIQGRKAYQWNLSIGGDN